MPARRTPGVEPDTVHDLGYDLQALASRAQKDRAFADELDSALCNADSVHDDWTEWRGARLRLVDFVTGEHKVLVNGEWVDE
jgi:hypothetical protein